MTAGDSAHTNVGRSAQPQRQKYADISMSDYNSDEACYKNNSNVPFIDTFGKEELMLNEHIAGLGEVASDEDTRNVPFIDNFGKHKLMLIENIDMFVRLIQTTLRKREPMRTDPGRHMPVIVRTNQRKR